jgi:hypothetical protein
MAHQHVPEHHLRVVQALQSGPRAPGRLHSRIEELHAEAAARDFGIALPRLRPAVAVAGVAVVLVVSLVVAMSVGGPGGSRVVQAAELSLLPSTEPPPATNTQRPELLERSFAGVTFPAWTEKFHWRADGARTDELDGRPTTTVYYTHTHHRIGYTVISGPPIDPPDDAERLNARGVELHRFRLGFQDVVTFERDGRTCVLSGDVHDPNTLVKLASWKADDSISF